MTWMLIWIIPKLGSIVTELFIRGVNLNISSTVFITQSYFQLPRDVRLNCKHFLLQKFQILNLCEICPTKPYSFSVIYTTLASDNLNSSSKNVKKCLNNWL